MIPLTFTWLFWCLLDSFDVYVIPLMFTWFLWCLCDSFDVYLILLMFTWFLWCLLDCFDVYLISGDKPRMAKSQSCMGGTLLGRPPSQEIYWIPSLINHPTIGIHMNWTCLQRPPVCKDHTFLISRVVFPDGFQCKLWTKIGQNAQRSWLLLRGAFCTEVPYIFAYKSHF